MTRAWAAWVLAGCAVALAGCSGCGKGKEPEKADSGFDPSTPDARAPRYTPAAPPADAAPSRYSLREKKELALKIDPEHCSIAAKHANKVAGLPETDPKGIGLISQCMKLGNVAWYGCVMTAQATAEISKCNDLYLITPDELGP